MYEAALSPIQINGVTIPNRIIRSAHLITVPDNDLIAYHGARAAGGVGLTILGAAGVHPTTARAQLQVWRDDILSFYEGLMERVSPYGMKVFQQLNHWGAGAMLGPNVQAWSSSPNVNPLVNHVPRVLTKTMIDEIVGSYGTAARRVKQGGIDGIEIHAAHGYLVSQFLSPALNTREDEYGGSLENRMRFLNEILDVVRAEVGADYPIGVRLVGDDHIPGGMGPAEYSEIAQILEDKIDFIDVSQAGYWRFHRMLATMELPLGYEMSETEQVTRKVSKVPTIAAGRIMTMDQANAIIESGAADMVSMVRATIADPDLVVKSAAGRAAEVRPCTGSGQGCLGSFGTGVFGCVMNIAAGQEDKIPFEATSSEVRKKVLVVGGGPAGLEAARTAAIRGHEVELHEAQRDLGGQIRMAASVRERADFASHTKWLEAELDRLGVTIKRGSFVDPDMIEAIAADEVIIATGGTPETGIPQTLVPSVPIPGSQLPHVFTSWDVLGFGGRAKIGNHVVIWDDLGNFEALTVGLHLVNQGVKVTFVTRHDFVGAKMPFPLGTVQAARERFLAGDVEVIGASRPVEITPEGMTIQWVDNTKQRFIEADTVVLVGWHHPNNELSEVLVEMGIAHHTIGDVNGSQDVMRAIREAAFLTRTL